MSPIGLLAFLVLVTLAFVWALVDGVRRGFVPSPLLLLVPAVVGLAIGGAVHGARGPSEQGTG